MEHLSLQSSKSVGGKWRKPSKIFWKHNFLKHNTAIFPSIDAKSFIYLISVYLVWHFQDNIFQSIYQIESNKQTLINQIPGSKYLQIPLNFGCCCFSFVLCLTQLSVEFLKYLFRHNPERGWKRFGN